MEFTTTKHYENWRLDRFLTEKLAKPRHQVQKQIKAGMIFVNGEATKKAHRFLEVDDVITLKERQETGDKEQGTKKQENKKSITDKIKKLFTKEKLTPKVVAKTKDYIIIEKPAGMLVHSTQKNEKNTIVDWLIKKYPSTARLEDPVELKKGLNTPYRPGIIHRLDREVSGLMLIPFNLNAFEYFKSQFKLRKIKKEYIALVHGQLTNEHGTIELEISRSAEGGRMAGHPAGSGKGKPSFTEYDIIKRYNKSCLIRVILKTGRTNQIRVHFFAVGHPLVGDRVYNLKMYRNKYNIKSEHLFLHANKLGFNDLKGNWQEFESPLPEYLTEMLKNLKEGDR